MNSNADRWHQCYWKEWDAIKKRWDELHATWREGADDGATQNKVKLSRLAVHPQTLTAAQLGNRP